MVLAQIDVLQSLSSFFDRMVDRPWVSITELVLIGSVVYTVLRFFQGTRGARLVRAVLILLAASFAIVWLIAQQVQSERIKVLYPYFILGVFLISLVAFQSELRRILLRLGEGGWLQRLVKDPRESLEPIITAVERLSRKKIGALIAVERMGEVSSVVDTGVALDAEMSSELLETIFWPGTPLHDLGVVVHRGRIQAAGCQFPLTESEQSDRTLGSRHRAGIGMSEEAEAVVIIVSEETGTVSAAIRGRLVRGLTPDTLRELLRRELTPRAMPEESEADAAPSAAPVPADAPAKTQLPPEVAHDRAS